MKYENILSCITVHEKLYIFLCYYLDHKLLLRSKILEYFSWKHRVSVATTGGSAASALYGKCAVCAGISMRCVSSPSNLPLELFSATTAMCSSPMYCNPLSGMTPIASRQFTHCILTPVVFTSPQYLFHCIELF